MDGIWIGNGWDCVGTFGYHMFFVGKHMIFALICDCGQWVSQLIVKPCLEMNIWCQWVNKCGDVDII